MRQSERGQYSAAQFIDELKKLITDIVYNVLSDNSSTNIIVEKEEVKKTPAKAADRPKRPRPKAIKSLEDIACPVCAKGHIIKGRTAYGCSEFRNGCSMLLPFSEYAPDLTPSKLNALIKKNFKK